MKSDRLQDALGMVRDDYVLDAHSEKKTRTWRRWGTLAACLCLIAVCAFGLPKLLHRETNPEPANPYAPDISQTTPTAPGTDSTDPMTVPCINFNDVEAMPHIVNSNGVSMVTKRLTETELSAVIPNRLAPWWDPQAVYAVYYGSRPEGEDEYAIGGRELESVVLKLVDTRENGLRNGGFNGEVTVTMRPAGQPVHYDVVFEPDEVSSTVFFELDGADPEKDVPVEVVLYRYRDEAGTYFFTVFTHGGVDYYVSAYGQDEEYAGAALYDVVSDLIYSTAPQDLTILMPNP